MADEAATSNKLLACPSVSFLTLGHAQASLSLHRAFPVSTPAKADPEPSGILHQNTTLVFVQFGNGVGFSLLSNGVYRTMCICFWHC